MSSQRHPPIRLRAATALALLLAMLPLASHGRVQHGRASIASSGTLGRPFAPEARVPDRAAVRRTLATQAAGTYIGEMLAERDSSLSRWPDEVAASLTVWIQPTANVDGWNDAYVDDVRDAFAQWNHVATPVHFSFTPDSADADVHVSFVRHFDEEISGRTRWARDDDWWITDGDIILAVYHRNGPILDDDAMHAMAMHEVGHLIGLDHTRDSTSIMAPRVRVRALSAADRATARLLYSLPPGGVR